MTRENTENLSTSPVARDFTVALAFEIRMRLMEQGHPFGFYARCGFRPKTKDEIEVEVTVPFLGTATCEVDLAATLSSFGLNLRPAAGVLSAQLVARFMKRTENASRESLPWPAGAEA